MRRLYSPKRIREVLETVNPNVVKEIEVEKGGARAGDVDWFIFKVGYKEYTYYVADADPYYQNEGIKIGNELIQFAKATLEPHGVKVEVIG